MQNNKGKQDFIEYMMNDVLGLNVEVREVKGFEENAEDLVDNLLTSYGEGGSKESYIGNVKILIVKGLMRLSGGTPSELKEALSFLAKNSSSQKESIKFSETHAQRVVNDLIIGYEEETRTRGHIGKTQISVIKGEIEFYGGTVNELIRALSFFEETNNPENIGTKLKEDTRTQREQLTILLEDDKGNQLVEVLSLMSKVNKKHWLAIKKH